MLSGEQLAKGLIEDDDYLKTLKKPAIRRLVITVSVFICGLLFIALKQEWVGGIALLATPFLGWEAIKSFNEYSGHKAFIYSLKKEDPSLFVSSQSI
ncbi:MAG: hypothetical protein JXQ74_02700 [Alphaproteobacteria bacterium]|nr:hypothetical protein [Alphaproteobacteria bacterium]